ncbi:MAG TPA: sigma 54-interacting transcriptional regulator [bacterium]|nr:sigma 54-interacting transcriptional regulator [bacterium]
MRRSWKILGRVGEGGMGEVYGALDPQGRKVAVKVLNPDSSPGLFEEEAKLLIRLRHPALVSVLGYQVQSAPLFEEEKGPCFWMDYVEGENFFLGAKKAGFEKILAWLKEALQALQYLHSQSVLHGDLSPSNLLIDRKGRLRILDFGLASLEGAPPKKAAGTLPYLAPECFSGSASFASDLFSLGSLFYQAIARRHPRAGCRSLQELIRKPALPLSEACPQLPPEFALPARVIDRMVETELSSRFSSAVEALEALSGSGADRPQGPFGDYHSARMFGAEGHFQKAGRALAELHERSAIFALHGMSGTGKKRFLRELAFKCALEGITVREIEPENFSRGLGELIQPGARRKAFFFRSLESLDPTELAPLLSLRRGAFSEKGIAALFEWNDEGLSEGGRRFFSNLLQVSECVEIFLKNLNRQDVLAMVRSALGEEAASVAAKTLFEQTAGNPQLLLETLNFLREKQALSKQPFSLRWLEELKSLNRLDRLFLARLQGLSADEKTLLLCFAAAQEPVELENLIELRPKLGLREGGKPLKSLLQPLIERGLLEKRPGENRRYRLSLPSFASALLKSVPLDDLEKIHQAWAETLAKAKDPHPQKIHHALFLKNAKGLDPQVREQCEIYGEAGEVSRALELIEEALPMIQGKAERSRLLRLKTNFLIQRGRNPEALESCEEAFALKADDEPLPLKTVKYWLASGILHRNLGNFSEGVRRLERCVKEAERFKDETHHPFVVQALAQLGLHDLQKGDLGAAKKHFEAGLKLAGPSGRRRAELLRNLGLALGEEKDWEGARRLFQEAARLYQEEGFAKGYFATLLQEGNLYLSVGQAESAEQIYSRAEAVAFQSGDELNLALVRNNRGVLARKRGRLHTALDRLGKAVEGFRIFSPLADLAESLKQRCMAEAAAGRFFKAEEDLKELSRMGDFLPQAKEAASDALRFFKEVKEGVFEAAPKSSETEPVPPWNLEQELRRLTSAGGPAESIREILTEIFFHLPLSLKVSFAERSDYRKFVQAGTQSPKTSPPIRPGGKQMEIINSLSALSRELLREEDMERVLNRLMDTAMNLSRAENGFLVLRSESEEGPIPGFRVAVARNVNREKLKTEEYAFSLSAVKEAMRTGEPVLTDNALSDPRFLEAKSVQLLELTSILALPIHGPRGVLGAFYLDHRFEAGLFEEETLKALKAFADLAALALQKDRMIEELKRSNADLSERVTEQSGRMDLMERELQENRIKLKNEYSEIVGRSPKMVQVLSMVDRITEAKVPVWIYGESGTGKEAIARALHYNSSRAKFPFATENCSALPETLMESELFGHKKGAFTHADRDKKGILAYADKGTIFLDEIADMSLNLQAKLLRFLQEGEVRPLGSNEVIKVDVRVVSASNRDLHELVAEGKFREDLFFRINGITVTLPPLRERLEDLPLLSEHFLQKIAGAAKAKPCRLHPEALRVLMTYGWPGNIRELQSTLETAALFTEERVITPASLQFKPALFASKKKGTGSPLRRPVLASMEPELEKILLTLKDHGYHKVNAARALGMSRRNLYLKLEKFGVPLGVKELKVFIDRRLI